MPTSTTMITTTATLTGGGRRRALAAAVAAVLLVVVVVLVAGAAVEAATDYYTVLGVKRSSTAKEIKREYKKLSRKYHPDKNPGDEAAHDKFVEIANAYDVLGDDEKRRIYDQWGEEGIKKQAGQKNQRGGGGGFGDVFSQFFGGGGGGGGHGHGGQKKGPSIEVDLEVSLEDLYLGADVNVEVQKNAICHKCRGSGAKSEDDVKTCPVCGGKGVVIKRHQMAPGFVQQVQQPCDRCGGKGKLVKSTCTVCRGRKTTVDTEQLAVVVERGMANGETLVYENEADQHPDHTAGDLVFRIVTAPHVTFTRKGNDLHHKMRITLLQALTGFETELVHLDGHRVPIVRTGVTKPHEVQTIKSEGMPVKNMYDQFGNLVIEYIVRFPTKVTPEQAEGFRALLQ